jgi:glucuronoarabinoxylan endo-1,4-beta-xylanase
MKLICLIVVCGFFGFASAQSSIVVDLNKTYQTIDGFGGFGPKEVWWENGPYYDQEYLDQTIDNLGATIFRTQIYWDGETTNDNSDPKVINANGFNFSKTSDNGKQFSFIKDLHTRGARIIASVWTPPVWMKLFDDPARIPDNCYNCNNCPKGDARRQVCGGRLNPIYYEEFAEYLVAYVKALKQQTGVDLYGISIQNEPYFANPFEANVMKANEYADVLAVVGKRFDDEGLTTKFFGPEHMAEWSWGVQKNYVNELLNDAQVKPYLDIYAVHGYVDGVAADYGSAEGWTELYNNIKVAHGKSLWMTETSNSDESGYTLAFNMSRALYLALKFGNITGWVYWYMSGSMIEDNKLTPLGYAFKNYYRFIRPGSIRLDATSDDNEVLTLAFKNPETEAVTVILINQSAQAKTVNVTLPAKNREFTMLRTSATENCASLGPANLASITLSSKSITTLTNSEMTETVGFKKKVEIETKVYPNPTVDEIIISRADPSASIVVDIFDSNGKRVFGKSAPAGETRFIVDAKSWPAGIYLVKTKTNKGIGTTKVQIK